MNDIFTLNLALIFRMKYGLKLNFIFKGDEVGKGLAGSRKRLPVVRRKDLYLEILCLCL